MCLHAYSNLALATRLLSERDAMVILYLAHRLPLCLSLSLTHHHLLCLSLCFLTLHPLPFSYSRLSSSPSHVYVFSSVNVLMLHKQIISDKLFFHEI